MGRLLRCPMLALAFVMLFAAAPTPLPPCRYDDVETSRQNLAAWPYTILDTIYKLSETYTPNDLVPLDEAGVGSDDMMVRSLVLPDLKALLAAAKGAGVALEVQSAYRSYAYQISTFAYWVEQDGMDVALTTSARPGHSEHQLGTALDFRSADGPAAWDLSDWQETPEGTWMAQNAARFGFVMSYPKGKRSLTCYSYEPWHYRYVGREVAAQVAASGLTLREWLWQYEPGLDSSLR